MNVIKRNENVSIVVVGNFDPTKLTPKWLYELNIITADEWNGQERNLLVSNPITKFKFGEIEFLSQPNRIQLISNDISESNELHLIEENLDKKVLQIGKNEINPGEIEIFGYSYNIDEKVDKEVVVSIFTSQEKGNKGDTQTTHKTLYIIFKKEIYDYI